jgi:hypothetical protein
MDYWHLAKVLKLAIVDHESLLNSPKRPPPRKQKTSPKGECPHLCFLFATRYWGKYQVVKDWSIHDLAHRTGVTKKSPRHPQDSEGLFEYRLMNM